MSSAPPPAAGSCSAHWSWKGSRSRSGHGQLSQEGSRAWGEPSARPTPSAGRLGSRAEKKGGVGTQPPNCFSRPGPLPRVLEARVPRTGHSCLPAPSWEARAANCLHRIAESILGAAGFVGAEHLGCGFKGKLSRRSAYPCVSCRSFWRDGLVSRHLPSAASWEGSGATSQERLPGWARTDEVCIQHW